ncbi:MAG: retron Ec67 family RNA-directed DNA polymerase/endonuclease, partial [Devosia sp.]
MSQLSKLNAVTNRKELAVLLGYKPKAMTAVLYFPKAETRYTTFEITKKSGGIRTIKAPDKKLKKLQKHLSSLLYRCLDEIENDRNANPISFGFRRKLWIADNAKRHMSRRWVLNLDLSDFFPSFNFGRVRGFFLKDKSFALPPEVATTIAQIACDGAALPQGSPCSPIIAELIARILDMRLIQLAKKYKITYSRYADDITFSTNQKNFPAEIAQQDTAEAALWHLSDELVSQISKCGFQVNADKTRMQFKGSRQMVTGLVVNEKVNVRSDYYRRARASCESLFSTGGYFLEVEPPVNPVDEPKPKILKGLLPLEGVLAHIYAVNQYGDNRDPAQQRKEPRAIRRLFRRFYFYKYFVALKLPLIVTEGKTDRVYLRSAVRSRTGFHPALGALVGKAFVHAVSYFDHEGRPGELLDLGGGGSANLISILVDYQRNLYPNKGEARAIASLPMAHPVILVLDNDDGLPAVAKEIKKKFKVDITTSTTAPFYHITDNLYVVKTPEKSGLKPDTCIEDLFPPSLLDTPLNL